MPEPKHTKLPWRSEANTAGHFEIYETNPPNGQRRKWVASVHSPANCMTAEELVANKDFIVLACNNHYKLLDACRSLLAAVRRDEPTRGMITQAAIERANAAISATTGKEGHD